MDSNHDMILFSLHDYNFPAYILPETQVFHEIVFSFFWRGGGVGFFFVLLRKCYLSR